MPELRPEIDREVANPEWCDGSDHPETVTHTERIEDHPDVQQAWEDYVQNKWLPWMEEHQAWEELHKVYSKLFAIRQELLRLGEKYELVLGLGLLVWQTPTGQRIRRHLVVANAVLEFDARRGQFTVRPHAEGADVRPELDMLDVAEQPPKAEETARALLHDAVDDPWGKECMDGLLASLAHSLQGEYDASTDAPDMPASASAVVTHAPALILRQRSTRGLTETLKRIKGRIDNGEPADGHGETAGQPFEAVLDPLFAMFEALAAEHGPPHASGNAVVGTCYVEINQLRSGNRHGKILPGRPGICGHFTRPSAIASSE